MPDLSSEHTDATQNRLQFKQTRARSQLSCRPCRQGKLKCGREHPCDQCIKRSREAACVYLPPAEKKKSGQNVRNRIQHLERLVVDLMNNKPNDSVDSSPEGVTQDGTLTKGHGSVRGGSFSQLTPPQDSENGELHEQSPSDSLNTVNEGAFGRMYISKNETNYVGENHWSTILNEITDLKRVLSDDEDEDIGPGDEQQGNDEDMYDENPEGITNLLRAPKRRSKADLIQALPARDVVDRYVSNWFNAPDPFQSIIHTQTFQEDYIRFWQNPARTPTMWIGLLYTILSNAAKLPFHSIRDPRSAQAQASLNEALKFHELAASAAALADYTTPKRYTLECLIMYLSGMHSTNSFVDTWQLLGLVVRLALRMGYHRDGRHFPNLSPFDQEMRRRIWHSLYMLDVLISFQIGLPSMLRAVQSDTQAPGNYMDIDLNPKMTSLPPTRPIQELTSVSYGLAKVRLCNVFANAAEMGHNIESISYDQVQELDNKLDVAHDMIPPPIKIRPFNAYIAERPVTLMWSFNLELLYLKTKIVLHRPFMRMEGSSPAALTSRRTCVDAAMKALRHHHEIYDASQSGGQLEVARMYMGSISTYDFLLASVVICLELAQMCASPSSLTGRTAPHDAYAKYQEMMDLLSRTHMIWSKDAEETCDPTFLVGTFKSAHTARETEKAAKAVGIMLSRARALAPAPSSRGSSTAQPASTDITTNTKDTTVDLTNSNGFTFDIAAADTGITPETPDMFKSNEMDLDLIGNMINMPDQIDWNSWDQAINLPPLRDDSEWMFDSTLLPDTVDPNLF